MWARMINPGNQSDYMLVEGHPRDKIPKKAPANVAEHTNMVDNGVFGNHQRVFEFNVGTAPNTFGWGPLIIKKVIQNNYEMGKMPQFSLEDKETGILINSIKWTSSCGPMMEHINQLIKTTKKQNRKDSHQSKKLMWIKSINFPHFGG